MASLVLAQLSARHVWPWSGKSKLLRTLVPGAAGGFCLPTHMCLIIGEAAKLTSQNSGQPQQGHPSRMCCWALCSPELSFDQRASLAAQWIRFLWLGDVACLSHLALVIPDTVCSAAFRSQRCMPSSRASSPFCMSHASEAHALQITLCTVCHELSDPLLASNSPWSTGASMQHFWH